MGMCDTNGDGNLADHEPWPAPNYTDFEISNPACVLNHLAKLRAFFDFITGDARVKILSQDLVTALLGQFGDFFAIHGRISLF